VKHANPNGIQGLMAAELGICEEFYAGLEASPDVQMTLAVVYKNNI
jgi:hypothetical protein